MKYFLLAPFILIFSCSEKTKKVEIYVTCTKCDARYIVNDGELIWDKSAETRNGLLATLSAKKDDGVTVTACEENEDGVTQIRVTADGETIKEEIYTGDGCFIFTAFVP